MKMSSPLTYTSPTRGEEKKEKDLSHRGAREKSIKTFPVERPGKKNSFLLT